MHTHVEQSIVKILLFSPEVKTSGSVPNYEYRQLCN